MTADLILSADCLAALFTVFYLIFLVSELRRERAQSGWNSIFEKRSLLDQEVMPRDLTA